MRSIHRLPLFLLLLVAPIDAQSVHVVDVNNGPGTDFVSLLPAVAAAASGDMILIREGDYSFEYALLNGRGITLQGEAGADVVIAAIAVRNLPAGEFFAARNLTVNPIFSINSTGVDISDCEGSIWLEDIHVLTPRALGGRPLGVVNSDQVVLIRCQLDQGLPGVGGSVFAFDSELHLFNCRVVGPTWVTTTIFGPADGALLQVDGEVFLYGSTLQGGKGADANPVGGNGEAGGPALIMNGTSPIVHILDSTLLGGPGGQGSPGANMGATGPEILQNAPNATVLPELGSMRSFEVNSPIRENGNLTIMADGFLGDQVFASTPSTPGPTLTGANFNGAAVVTVFPVQALGTLAVSGPQTLTQTIGQLAPGQEFQTIFAQAYFLDSVFTVSTPTMTVFLDDGF